MKGAAIRVAHQLVGFSDLGGWLREHDGHYDLRRSLAIALGQVVAQLHNHKLKHQCLSDKHIFVRLRPQNDVFYVSQDIAFIDLEKMKKGFFELSLENGDIKRLIRHSPLLSSSECELLLCNYRQERIRLKKQKKKSRRLLAFNGGYFAKNKIFIIKNNRHNCSSITYQPISCH